MKNVKQHYLGYQHGFTFVEAILYTSILTIMLSTLIPFAWNMVEGGSKSSVQEEVSSNARYLSERIKYEIRNASGINSVSATTISLAETNSSINPTVITYTAPNVAIKRGSTDTFHALNSNNVNITSFTFTNNTSSDSKTKNISFICTLTQLYSGTRKDFSSNITIQSSAEVRSN